VTSWADAADAAAITTAPAMKVERMVFPLSEQRAY
jgi:hypothetical protein